MRVINLAMLELMIKACEKYTDSVPAELRDLCRAAKDKQELRNSSKKNTWLPLDALKQYFAFLQSVAETPESKVFKVLFMTVKRYSSINSILVYMLRFNKDSETLFKHVADCEHVSKMHTAFYTLDQACVPIRYQHAKLLFSFPLEAPIIARFFVALKGNDEQDRLFDQFRRLYSCISSEVAMYAEHQRNYHRPQSVVNVEKFITFLTHMRGRDHFDSELLELAMMNLRHIESIHFGVMRLVQAHAFTGLYRQLVFTYPEKADQIGAILRTLPSAEYQRAFAALDFSDYSIMRLQRIFSQLERMRFKGELTFDAFKTLLVVPPANPPQLTLNGEDFNWRDFKSGGIGQIQAQQDAMAYRARLKRNAGMLFTRPDPRMEEESEYIALDFDDEPETVLQRQQEWVGAFYETSDDEGEEVQDDNNNSFERMWGFRY